MGQTGPLNMRAPGIFPCPTQLNGLGQGVFIGIPCPCSCSGHRLTHPSDGSPLKIGGHKWGALKGISAGGPRTGEGRGLPETAPPGPVYEWGLASENPPCPAP